MADRKFIDLFAGCGGLSLGLSQAGWRGLFAIERDDMAFRTLHDNLLARRSRMQFQWPEWLECRAWSINEFLKCHARELRGLRDRVDLIAGGPPCQGFSFSGRRNRLDPRNMLFKKYVSVVDAVRPSVLFVENVPGIRVAHGAISRRRTGQLGRPPRAFSERLLNALDELGYHTEGHMLDASQFGVPQRRPRFIILGVRRDLAPAREAVLERIRSLIEELRIQQVKDLGLRLPVTARDAIGDLETVNGLQPCLDPASRRGLEEPIYRGPRSRFQRLMHNGLPQRLMDSTRLARHTDRVRERFARILAECRPGIAMSSRDRVRLGLLKHRIHPLAADQPAATVTTLPDDLLHYREPRILSVRECARLQSFPDSFNFRGKYTTGGRLRARECPRYTQVGNAVPPLLGRALGGALGALLDELENRRTIVTRRAAI